VIILATFEAAVVDPVSMMLPQWIRRSRSARQLGVCETLGRITESSALSLHRRLCSVMSFFQSRSGTTTIEPFMPVWRDFSGVERWLGRWDFSHA
jgi:hypothetical protein